MLFADNLYLYFVTSLSKDVVMAINTNLKLVIMNFKENCKRLLLFSLFLLFVSGVSAQIQVTGVVIDEVDESPLIGVTVMEVGTQKESSPIWMVIILLL